MERDQLTFLGFDTETTGKYPLESEVCEIAAVKYQNGKVVDQYQTLIRPRALMSAEVIKIHGITNEMVANAPRMEDVIGDFHRFIQGTYMIAHHAPFDLGFLTVAFEKAGLALPELPVICSSRLSRAVIDDSINHKLQTLIPHLGIPQGQAHRALDDAAACLQVALHCFERAKLQTLQEILDRQGGPMYWKDYSLNDLKFQSKDLQLLIEAIEQHKSLRLTYKSGSKPGRSRVIEPVGLVRNPDGDYFIAFDGNPYPKRFYVNKIALIERL